MSAFNGTSSVGMTGPDTALPHGHYSHKQVSGNVHRLQEGLNRYLDRGEKEHLVAALNDYQSRRNVVDFVHNLKVVLDTSEKRQAILPLLRRILPPSDLDVYDHCIQSKQRYGTTPRGASGVSWQSQPPRATSTLPSTAKRSVKSDGGNVRLYKDKTNLSATSKHLKSSGTHFRNKNMIRGNDLFRVHVPQPTSSEGFGFSIRGGSEYGVGIYVSHVIGDGWASGEGLQAGDLILEVNDISFRKITHDEAANIIRSARKLDLVICRVGRIPGSYSVHQSYIWVDPNGRPVSPPPELEQIGQARSGDQRRSGLMLLKAADERKINIFVEDEASLGLMIRGGREFGLGIYITGVDRNSVSHRAGLKVGDHILDINGQSFLDISHTDAVRILKDSSHMIMIIKDVGKIPYAKTTVDKTLWLPSDQIRRSHSNRELSNPYRETVGDARKQTVFLRGAGSQLMLNSMATQQWDMIQERARHLLNASEQETLRLHADDYQRRFIRVEELVLSLSDLLNTSAKFSLMTEVRNLVYPKDLDKYDALVMRREVEMIKNRQKYLAEDGRSSPESLEPDYSPLPSDRKFEHSKHHHNSSPESSPEFSSVPHRRHDGKYSPHHGNQSQIFTSTGNITLMKKPPRHKLNASSGDRLYYNTSGSFVDMAKDQRSRLGGDLRKARSEEHLLVTADVHDGMYSVAKPVEEIKTPAEGDSGVYMNGSSGSDSSSPSNRHLDSGLKYGENKSNKQTPVKDYPSSSPQDRTTNPVAMETDMGEFFDMWRSKYGDIHFEPITIYKTKPTLGLAIEGGANTRQPLPRVISVQPGGSAYESGGIKVGHILLEVNRRCLVGMEHNNAARAIAEAFKNKSLDRMELLVTETNTDVKAVLERCQKS